MFDLSNQAELSQIRRLLLDWFAVHQRPLPWRRSYHPYQVWIAEIMGQQTQMERVAVYFSRWLERFPDIAAVAAAPEQAILKAWEGLGYYSRARNIQRTAQLLLSEEGGEIPQDRQRLLSLPGIGPYTAAAILSIAFDQAYPLVDANVERFFARIADIPLSLKTSRAKKQVAAMAESLLDREQPRAFNQALMELGALVCTPKQPDCDRCPVRAHCRALRADTVEFRPLPSVKQKKIEITMACTILHANGEIFIQQRLPDDIWGSLWEFPGGRLEANEQPLQAARRETEEETGWRVPRLTFFKTVIHHFTRYRVTLHGFLGELAQATPPPQLTAASAWAWIPPERLNEYPFPAGHRQLVAALREHDFPGIR